MEDGVNARGLGAITRTSRVRAYEKLHLPPYTVLSRATVIKVGELVGAAQVIGGEISVDGDALTVKARPIRIDVGRAETEVTERGSLGDLFALVQKVSRRAVRGGSDAAPGPMPSLQALEQYVKGLLAEQSATRAAFLEAALKLDPGYDRARLALWEVRTAQGDHAAALAAARAVGAASPDARRAKFLAGVSLMSLNQNDEAFTVFKGLQDAQSEAAILNNLGVIQLRRPSSADTGKPTYYRRRPRPSRRPICFPARLCLRPGSGPRGDLLAASLRRNPVDGDAHFVLASALDAAGSSVEAGRERELAAQRRCRRRRVGAARRAAARPTDASASISESFAERIDQAIAMPRSAASDLAQFHLERGRRLFEANRTRGDDGCAARCSSRPTRPRRTSDRPIHLRAGRPHGRSTR